LCSHHGGIAFYTAEFASGKAESFPKEEKEEKEQQEQAGFHYICMYTQLIFYIVILLFLIFGMFVCCCGSLGV